MNIYIRSIIILGITFAFFGNCMATETKHWRDAEYYEFTYYSETIIDAPIEKVWPHALNTRGWLNDLHTETVAGEVGKVGHIERVTHPSKIDDDLSLRNYHYDKLIEVVPNKLFTLKVFSEKGGSYGGLENMSFDTFILTENNGKTKVSLVYNAEHPRDGKTDLEIQAGNEAGKKGFDKRFVNFWMKLKNLVEANN